MFILFQIREQVQSAWSDSWRQGGLCVKRAASSFRARCFIAACWDSNRNALVHHLPNHALVASLFKTFRLRPRSDPLWSCRRLRSLYFSSAVNCRRSRCRIVMSRRPFARRSAWVVPVSARIAIGMGHHVLFTHHHCNGFQCCFHLPSFPRGQQPRADTVAGSRTFGLDRGQLLQLCALSASGSLARPSIASGPMWKIHCRSSPIRSSRRQLGTVAEKFRCA